MTDTSRSPRKGSTVPGASPRKTEGDALERYYTPHNTARGVCRRWQRHIDAALVVDPFAGGGAWLRAAMEVGAGMVSGCDLDPTARSVVNGSAYVGDGLELMAELRPRVPLGLRQVIATNPPFTLTNETVRAIQAALAEGRASAAILLARLTMAEGWGRRGLWRAHPPLAALVPARRISWEGPGGELMNGTDNFGSLVVLWTAERVAYGETRIALGWDPSDEGVGGQQVELLGGLS